MKIRIWNNDFSENRAHLAETGSKILIVCLLALLIVVIARHHPPGTGIGTYNPQTETAK